MNINIKDVEVMIEDVKKGLKKLKLVQEHKLMLDPADTVPFYEAVRLANELGKYDKTATKDDIEPISEIVDKLDELFPKIRFYKLK